MGKFVIPSKEEVRTYSMAMPKPNRLLTRKDSAAIRKVDAYRYAMLKAIGDLCRSINTASDALAILKNRNDYDSADVAGAIESLTLLADQDRVEHKRLLAEIQDVFQDSPYNFCANGGWNYKEVSNG